MVYFRTNIGRLGNQLFIVAFAISLKARYGINYCFSEMEFADHFRSSKWVNWLKRQFFFRFLVRLEGFTKLDFLESYNFDPKISMMLSEGHSKCIGYFQSPEYFDQYRERIIKKLNVRKAYQMAFNNLYGNIFNLNCIVVTVIHVRRTDYANHKIPQLNQVNPLLPMSYYKKAVAQSAVKDSRYILIGDDVGYLQENFHWLPNQFIIHESEIIDLQVLMNADICILSNSTFAWWGAYLNQRSGSKIYAPKHFVGYNARQEYPVGIYPKDWIQIDQSCTK